MKNVKLTIEYDGTNYSGWQIQNNAITIQQILEESLKDITGESLKIIGSSRTDAGVHARGFVGNFLTESKIPSDRFRNILNSKLPEDIVILNSEEVELNFNSRFNSKGKTYSYTVLNTPQRPAIGRNYVYHFRRNIDVALMVDASKQFIGTHDFAAFKSSGGNTKTTVRTISSLKIVKQGDYIIFTITGDGFLYNMVRIIVGTLIEVGLKRVEAKRIKDILISKDRTMSGPCVPPGGLCLEKVYY
ncbi:MAG: tRNA pseudouridine(38-40) synthase TruA [Clostridium sp.]|uniref:tRNA pseudouridine(38-40) synthase TruA n=1 Tax=Clostridium sp. TaxID=1506 RepID=UPI0039EBF1D1